MIEYFTKGIAEAVHDKVVFAIGDEVALRRMPMDELRHKGVITAMVHGNYGKGRIWAIVKFNDGFVQKFPLGSLRIIK